MQNTIKVRKWQGLGAGRYRIFGECGGGGFFADFCATWLGGDQWEVHVEDTNYMGPRDDLKGLAFETVSSM